MLLKAEPIQSVNNLIPPAPDTVYRYFEHRAMFPFAPAADGYSLVNAAWLADASMLAYGDATSIEKQVGKCKSLVFPQAQPGTTPVSTQGVIFRNLEHAPDTIIVAFRGTRVDSFPIEFGDIKSDKLLAINWKDLLVDVDLAPDPYGIHRGFNKALDDGKVWDGMLKALKDYAGKRIWFTGHSLGAALATIAAARFAAQGNVVQGLYTFGSPRVGTARFARTVTFPCVRFVNNQDVVTRMPPSGPIGGYVHVGDVRYINSLHQIQNDAHVADLIADALFSRLHDWTRLTFPRLSKETLRESLEDMEPLNINLPPNAFFDHAPLNYCCHLWNAIPSGSP